MVKRCYDVKCEAFKNYGARGIIVCDGWKDDFMSFYTWAKSNGWREGLELDRIDNDGNYEPSNCQFITSAENNAIGKKRKFTNNKSGYTGVGWHKLKNKWVSSIFNNNKLVNLGYYHTIEEAAQARIDAEIFYFGKQMTNFI